MRALLAILVAGATWGQSSASGVTTSPRVRTGPQLIAMGDSITARDDDPTNNVHADSYIDYALFATNAKFNLVRNSGVGGNTTAQMVARFATDVLAYSPQAVSIMGGTNDTIPSTQTLPNLKSMILSSLSAGILPILCTIPPQGTAAISPPTVTLTPSITGGTLSTGTTYAYRVSSLNGAGETLASTEQTTTIVSGNTGSVAITWPQVAGATAYKIYGRSSGAELLIATNNNSGGQSKPLPGYTDTGAATPSGALPVSNTTAVAYNSTSQTKIAGVNSVVMQLAQQYSLPVVDMYAIEVDPSTGMYKTGFTIDGTHPTDIQSQAMGTQFATALSSVLQAWTPYIAQTQTDLSVIYGNPLFGSNNGTRPTGWGPSGGTFTESIGTDSNVKGSVYTFACTSSTVTCANGGPSFTGWSVGDVVSLSGWWKVTGASVGGSAAIGLATSNGAITRACYISVNADTPGSSGWVPFYCEGTISAGTTAINIVFNLQYGTVTAALAQITVRDLTALGVR